MGEIIKALNRYMKAKDAGPQPKSKRRGAIPEDEVEEKVASYSIFYHPDENIARLASEWIPIPDQVKVIEILRAQIEDLKQANKYDEAFKALRASAIEINDKGKGEEISKELIKESISNGHFEEAIKLLRDLAKDSHYENDTIGLQGRFNGVERDRSQHVISHESYNRSLARIRESIFYILKKL